MKKIVMKALTVDGVNLKFGDIVDVSEWKYAIKLQEQRYIADVPSDAPLTVFEVETEITEPEGEEIEEETIEEKDDIESIVQKAIISESKKARAGKKVLAG